MNSWFLVIPVVILVNLNVIEGFALVRISNPIRLEYVTTTNELSFRSQSEKSLKELMNPREDHTHEEDRKPDYRSFSFPNIVGTASLASTSLINLKSIGSLTS